jgi:acyl-CoA reductase-like NAD-dependent aldehyde dehydrogenase
VLPLISIADQHAFGPIMKFDSNEDAIKLANDSKYGLGCAVFSSDQNVPSEKHPDYTGVAAINDFASSYMCQVAI